MSSRPLSIAYAKTLLDIDIDGRMERYVDSLVELIEEDLDQWFDHGVKKGHADAVRVLKGLQDGNIRSSEIQGTNVGEGRDSEGRSVRQGDALYAKRDVEGNRQAQAPLESGRPDDFESDGLSGYR